MRIWVDSELAGQLNEVAAHIASLEGRPAVLQSFVAGDEVSVAEIIKLLLHAIRSSK